MIDKELLDLLVCPVCKGELEYRTDIDALDCPSCRLRFPVEDEIPVMLQDRAEKI